MGLELENWWVYKFNNTIHITYQQAGSVLENRIDPGMVHRNIKANIDHHERLGLMVANDVIQPYGPTKVLNINTSRRACFLQSSDAALQISDEDTLRSMVEQQSPYTKAIVSALGRRADRHVITNAVGNAQVAASAAGTGVLTYSTQGLLTANSLGTGIATTLANIIAAGVRLSKGSVPPGPTERLFLYSPGQLTDLMAITQASSSDFTKNQIHDRGTIDGLDWEGFHWMEIQDVLNEDATTASVMLPLTSTTRTCIAMHRGAIGLSIGRDIKTYIDVLPQTNHVIQVRAVMAMSAVRVWEAGVVSLDVLEN